MITTVMEILGGALVVLGIALVFVPASLVVAGLLIIAASWRLES